MGILRKIFGSRSTDLAGFIKEGALVIDVRSSAEFESGHLHGSKNIPLQTLKDRIAEVRKMGKPVITVCQSGIRSRTAKAILESHGISAVNGGSWSALDAVIRKSS